MISCRLKDKMIVVRCQFVSKCIYRRSEAKVTQGERINHKGLSFIKMHGLGNDYIYIDPLKKENREQMNSTFWGQTCDSNDYVIKNRPFPKMETGEYIVSQNCGAYNSVMCSCFNGFELPINIYIDS